MKILFTIILYIAVTTVCTAGSAETAKKYNDIANEHYKQEKYVIALKNINYAIELEPENGSFIRHRGLIYYKQNKLPESARDFITAIKINKNDAMAHFLLASIMGINKQNDLALKYANKALVLNNGENISLNEQILNLVSALNNNLTNSSSGTTNP